MTPLVLATLIWNHTRIRMANDNAQYFEEAQFKLFCNLHGEKIS
jgi:hypothetical protein